MIVWAPVVSVLQLDEIVSFFERYPLVSARAIDSAPACCPATTIRQCYPAGVPGASWGDAEEEGILGVTHTGLA